MPEGWELIEQMQGSSTKSIRVKERYKLTNYQSRYLCLSTYARWPVQIQW